MLILACFTVSLAYTLPGVATRWLGKRDISYGVFLYHGLPLSLLVEWELSGNIWYMVLVATVTILLAWFSFRYVETPAMAWAKRRNAELKLRQQKPLPIVNIDFSPGSVK
jgi:peptidoglycan/LPS O-acetylase OafA/YrhL